MLTIAHSELLQLLRNRSVLVTSLLMPLAASTYLIMQRDTFAELGGLGYIGALLVFTIAAFTLYAATVTTLAARRQSLFLKRLRSTAATDGTILTGLTLPVTAISVAQTALVVGVLAQITGGPARPLLLLVAVAAIVAMMLAFGVATAGITRSPEHAQVTALPLSLGVIVVASVVGISGTEELTWLKRLLPGGSATELVVAAWDGGTPLGDALPLLLPTLGWVGIAIAVATAMFRWEPRG